VVLTEKTGITKVSENRIRLVFQGVAGLGKSLMDECICTPKPPALPTAPHPEMIALLPVKNDRKRAKILYTNLSLLTIVVFFYKL